jgi:hypothetical protein
MSAVDVAQGGLRGKFEQWQVEDADGTTRQLILADYYQGLLP